MSGPETPRLTLCGPGAVDESGGAADAHDDPNATVPAPVVDVTAPAFTALVAAVARGLAARHVGEPISPAVWATETGAVRALWESQARDVLEVLAGLTVRAETVTEWACLHPGDPDGAMADEIGGVGERMSRRRAAIWRADGWAATVVRRTRYTGVTGWVPDVDQSGLHR